MISYRTKLPQTTGQVLLTDGGLETTLVFCEDIDLPDFAAFPLLADESGRVTLRTYYRSYADVARRHHMGIVLETPTWRASSDWGSRLGFGTDQLDAINTAAVELLGEIRAEFEPETTVVISGNIGPRGDGYDASIRMTSDEAERYHRSQIATFANAGADLVTVLTLTYVDEAIGVVRAARAEAMPIAVSFTVETDGNLPSGQPLREAIRAVDEASGAYPVHYGINCAHPDHIDPILLQEDAWTSRIGLLRANASRMSHAELDDATELDAGNPVEMGAQYATLRHRLPTRVVLGGCCGTDDRHVDAIASACTAQ